MKNRYDRRLVFGVLLLCTFFALPAVWAKTAPSPSKPPMLDDVKLKEKILARIQKANSGKNDAYQNVDLSKIVIEKEIPFQVLGQTLYAVRIKILPVAPGQTNEFLYIAVDPTLTVQYSDILSMDTGGSVLAPVMMELRDIKPPKKDFGANVYTGGGAHRVVLVSDPFCPYCRHVWAYLFQHKDKIKSLRMSYYPIHADSALACAVLEYALKKRMDMLDIINFSYTKLTASKSPADVLKQYTAAFPSFKNYWGNDLDAAARKLQAEYTPLIQKERMEAKNMGIVGTPVAFVDGHMIEGGNIPQFDKWMP